MRHDVVEEGPAFRLRPVELADAAFIVMLRQEEELSRFVHPISQNVIDQEQYLRAYYERADDYYFIIERKDTGSAEGTIGLYDIDELARSGEWGRWIVRPGSLAAVESALLIYRVAFTRLELNRVYCRTVAANTRVISFHNSSGLRLHRQLPKHFMLRGQEYDAVEHEIMRGDWSCSHAILYDRASRLARILTRDNRGSSDNRSA